MATRWFSPEDDVKEHAKRLVQKGFKSVTPFRFEKKRKKNEEFTWDYVKAHKI